MKLIASLTSPFARKVRIVIAEKKIKCEFVEDVPWNENTQVPEHNPLGKVPVLLLDDGTALYDSRVIVEYLDLASPVSKLMPELGRERTTIRRWEALADGVADAAATIFLEKKRPEAQQSAEWLARQQKKVELGLRAMSDDLGERLWCAADGYTLADIAVGCTLGYLSLRFPKIAWRKNYANLAALADRLDKRPAFKNTAPPKG